MSINNYLDNDGFIKVWPSKLKNKKLVAEYIFAKIENKEYTEKEITDAIRKLISFDDPATIRRALIDDKLLMRDTSGKVYSKSKIVIE